MIHADWPIENGELTHEPIGSGRRSAKERPQSRDLDDLDDWLAVAGSRCHVG